MARKPDYDSFGPAPVGVTGSPASSRTDSGADFNHGGLEEIPTGDGTQSGQHPAKTQSKIMRFFE